jgi:hypothetical protein
MSEKTGLTNTFAQDLGDAARQNPVSAALIGMGIVWLFTRRGVGNLLNRSGLDRPIATG